MEITHLGSGICSYKRRITGAIFCETRPAMIIRSLCRGDGLKTSAPNLAMSYREPPIDIISIAQHAKPKVMGHTEFFRTQLIAASSEASTTPSGCSSPQLTSSSLSRFLPKLSSVPKIYRSLRCGTPVGRPLLLVSFALLLIVASIRLVAGENFFLLTSYVRG